ncbi:MAG: cell division protein FtsB [Pseudomonadota bacterium]
MINWVLSGLILLLILIQSQLWSKNNGIPVLLFLQKDVERIKLHNTELQNRNQKMIAEVSDLKEGMDAIEERARYELGMIKEGEVFFRLVEKASTKESADEQ